MFDWLNDITSKIDVLVGIFTIVSGIILRGYAKISSTTKTINKLKEIPERIESIQKELTNNGGSSLKDAVQRIEKSLCVERVKMRFLLNESEHICFETDAEGHYISANERYLNMLGIELEDCLNNSWKNYIHVHDREFVFENWNLSIKEEKSFNHKYRLIDAKDNPIPVHIKTFPIQNVDRKIIGWLGIVNRLNEIPKEWQDLH